VDFIPHQPGTQATGHKLTTGRDDDLDEGAGVSLYSSSLLEEVISSFSFLFSFCLSSLVDRLVTLGLAIAMLLGLGVFLLAILKPMDEVFSINNKCGWRRKGE